MTENNVPETALEAIRHFGDPLNCHNFVVGLRWANGARCPHCGSEKVGKFSGKRMVSNCKICKKQFTVKVGTIFEDSPLPLTKWIPAVWLIVNAKNGISSCELARSLGVTQKTAWHMGHRIRKAIHAGTLTGKLEGIVEVDETYIGGLARNKHTRERLRDKIEGRRMTVIQGLLQRDRNCSKIVTKVLKSGRKQDLQKNVRDYVLAGSSVFTDKNHGYKGLVKNPDYSHKTVDHMLEYVNGNVHTNSLENFWTLLKRSIKGTYVHCAPFHLHRYLDEQAYRFNERAGNDSDRFVKAMRKTPNLRLTYRKLTGKE